MKNTLYQLPIIILKEGNQFVAYTPALDISTTGNTEDDARKKFKELVAIFLEEITAMGTVNEVLTGLGWKKTQKTWNPPYLISSDFIDIKIPALT